MHAILEAPVPDTDLENQSQFAPPAEHPDEDLGISTFESEFILEDARREPKANATLRRDCADFLATRVHGIGDIPPAGEGNTGSPAWPPAETEIPRPPQPVLRKDFDALYHTYERRVYRQCYRMLGNQEDAEDLTQEVFLQLYRKADTFRGEASFSTWLHRLTINTVLMQMRRFRRWRSSVTSLDVVPTAEDGANEFPAAVSALPAQATNPMDKISLDVAIAQLSSGYKEIFLLHDQEGYRHDEIAKLLGISEGTSKSQLHKARLRLRDLVEAGDRTGKGISHGTAARKCRRKHCDSLRAG